MSINRNYSDFLGTFHSEKFRELWTTQDYVLQTYANKYSPNQPTLEKTITDVAIELPTGAGKTLIALLIAETWRQEKKKVAILSANKTLARQMMAEADSLGIPAVLMEGKSNNIPAAAKRGYQRAQKIAIMNYWVYFNQNPVLDPADCIIMDDAHLAEHCLHSLYSVEINKNLHTNLFKELITLLHNRFPDYTILSDAMAEETSIHHRPPTQLLSFIDQISIDQKFKEVIESSNDYKSDQDLSFRWNRMREKLREANIYISATTIWIRPYIYPLLTNNHYKRAQQRLYFSATIGDPQDLSRRLGTEPIKKMPIPIEFRERTTGRRLIFMSKEDPEDSGNLSSILETALSIEKKAVWLCSSRREAEKYKDKFTENSDVLDLFTEQESTTPTWILTPQGDEIDDFKNASEGHLFVAGRYDGMDFNGDECRIVVIPTIPRAINIQEEFIYQFLKDARFMRMRLNQRIIQALGRCNRSANDYGVYLLLDKQFASYFGVESNREGMSRNIMAEMDMAQDLAEAGHGIVASELRSFLSGDFSHYDTQFEAYLSSVPGYDDIQNQEEPDIAKNEVIGWSALFEHQNYEIAAKQFKSCWEKAQENNLLELGAFYGYLWAKALYLQSLQGEPTARDKSLNVLEASIKRGGQSAWFNRLRSSLNRARYFSSDTSIMIINEYASTITQNFNDLLEELGVKERNFNKHCESITRNLNSNNHKQFQQGLVDLGTLLGYRTSIPNYQGATDCVWRGIFGNTREVFTFEAKIEHDSSKSISYHDIGQVHGQISRAEQENPGYTVRGVVVTHLTEIASEAEASAKNIKIIEQSAIIKLWHRVEQLLKRYKDNWSFDDIQAKHIAAQKLQTLLPGDKWLLRALDETNQRFINTDILCKEWNHFNI